MILHADSTRKRMAILITQRRLEDKKDTTDEKYYHEDIRTISKNT